MPAASNRRSVSATLASLNKPSIVPSASSNAAASCAVQVRVSAKEQKLISEKNKKARTAGSSGSTNGLASSLAFTPVQGIELVNPNQKADANEGTETYFAKSAAFFKANM